MHLKMLLFLENELLKAHFFSKVKPNRSLWYVYWPAQTNFGSNVAREPKRVAHPCTRLTIKSIIMVNLLQLMILCAVVDLNCNLHLDKVGWFFKSYPWLDFLNNILHDLLQNSKTRLEFYKFNSILHTSLTLTLG